MTRYFINSFTKFESSKYITLRLVLREHTFRSVPNRISLKSSRCVYDLFIVEYLNTTGSMESIFNDPLTTASIEETFLQDFLVMFIFSVNNHFNSINISKFDGTSLSLRFSIHFKTVLIAIFSKKIIKLSYYSNFFKTFGKYVHISIYSTKRRLMK